jgi:hypothetical protein
LAHHYNSGNSEARGTDANEHTRAEGFFGKLLCHEAVDEGGVDHERHKEAYALNDISSQNDGEGYSRIFNLWRKVTGVRSDDEQRVCWEDPDGRHLRDGECRGGPPSIVSILVLV